MQLMRSKLREHIPAIVIGVIIAAIFATGLPWWFQYFDQGREGSGAQSAPE